MPRRQVQQLAALGCVAAASLVGTRALAAGDPPQAGSPFGGAMAQHVRTGGFEVNLAGGTLRQVRCAPGSQPGTTCYLAR